MNKIHHSPIRINSAGQKQKLKVNTRPDVESEMSKPTKKKGGAAGRNLPSPTKTEPLTPTTITFEHNVRSSGGGGGSGFCKWKPCLILAAMLGLAGGLAYFLLSWLEVPGLDAEIDRLQAETDRLAGQLTQLNSEITRLENQNDIYEGLNRDLDIEVADLEVINKNLTITVADLEEIAGVLNSTVEENKKLNMDLKTITAFIDQTTGDLGNTFDSITTYLSQQIAANQELVEQSLESYYKALVSDWDCDYRTVFEGKLWATNYNVEISFEDQQLVIDYVTSNVLDELCIDKTDFTQFLESNYTPLTSTKLIAAVTVATLGAIDYYFPEVGEDGMTHSEWAAADFKCENLERKFEL